MMELEICKKCLKPKENDLECDHCGSEETIISRKYYSIKQWEYFIDSLKGGALHDFYPWEFDEEDGGIKRGGGFIGTIGPRGPEGQAKPKRLGNNRKSTKGRNQHKKKSTRKKKKHGRK